MSKNLRNTVHLHGELYNSFDRALVGKNLLFIAFGSKNRSLLWYALWSSTILMFSSLIASQLLNSGLYFAATVGFMLLFFTLAELALQRGIAQSFPNGSPVSNLSKQPWRLRRAIIRYVYFCEYLHKVGKLPSVQDIDDTLEFIEANRNGRPPSWTSFLRHPLTVMMFGIFAYMINAKVIGGPTSTADWTKFANGVLTLCFVLMGAGLIYMLRYMDPNTHWQFECCLRWYRIHRKESTQRPQPPGRDV